MLLVNHATQKLRLEICAACEHYVEKTKSCGPLVTEAFTDSPVCGCFMPGKAKLSFTKCPLGKWEAAIKEADIQAVRAWFENMDNESNESLAELYNRLSGERRRSTTCAPCNREMIKELKKLLKRVEKDG